MKENVRELMTIRGVDEVNVHPNADALELLRVGGWQVVAKKGDFQSGDSCVFIEVDAVLPDGNPAWQFLVDKQGKQYERGLGARLKTIKLRGEYSQGLALPVSAFDFRESHNDILKGKTLDEVFGVYKYERPETGSGALAGNARGDYPHWIPKTDQSRVENVYNGVKRQVTEETMFIIEEKLEGSSTTIYVNDELELGITSRNIDFKLGADEPTNAFIDTVKKQGLDLIAGKEEWRRKAIRGELVGPGIQGNIYKLEEYRIYIFDIWDGVEMRYLDYYERQRWIDKLKALGAVVYNAPMLGVCKGLPDRDIIIKESTGMSVLNPNQLREGYVFKECGTPAVPVIRPISFKSISREYLEKQ